MGIEQQEGDVAAGAPNRRCQRRRDRVVATEPEQHGVGVRLQCRSGRRFDGAPARLAVVGACVSVAEVHYPEPFDRVAVFVDRLRRAAPLPDRRRPGVGAAAKRVGAGKRAADHGNGTVGDRDVGKAEPRADVAHAARLPTPGGKVK